MNCRKCGRELMVSHVEKNENGEIKRVLVCLNEKCSEYSSQNRIKPKKS